MAKQEKKTETKKAVSAPKAAPKKAAPSNQRKVEEVAPQQTVKTTAPSNKKAAPSTKVPTTNVGLADNDSKVSTKDKQDIILDLKNITKTFLGGKIIANDDVSLSFVRNEIHAIVGENGSGKSTLMNIIFGLYKQDKGVIYINNKKVDMYQSGAAKKYKIGMVHQHFHLVDTFSVLENVLIGQEELTKAKKDKLKVKSYKKELKQVISELKKLKKLESMKLVHNDQGAKVVEEDINFVAAVEKILNDRHEAQLEIEREINIINKLKIEKSGLSEEKKHDLKRIEEIDDEVFTRKQLIKAEKEVIALVDDYEHGAKNEDQEKVVELVERKFFLLRELNILDVKLTGLFGKIKKKEALARLIEIQIKYQIHLDPFAKVRTLSVGQRQMVEILKVLWEEKEIIVFDEPTATLSVVEIDALMKTFDSLKKEGKTIIFISHKLKEVKAVADRVSILRKGVMMGTYVNDSSLKPATIGELMVGKTIELDFPVRKIEEKPLFKADSVSYTTKRGFESLRNVSFEIYEGEIFGLAGIEGNGQEELVKIITNLRRPTHGTVSLIREVDKKKVMHIIKKQEKEFISNAKEEIQKLKEEHNNKVAELIEAKGKKEARPEIEKLASKLEDAIGKVDIQMHANIHEIHNHTNEKYAIHLMKENAQILHDKILEEAHEAEKKLGLPYLDRQIHKDARYAERKLKMEFLDKKSEAIALHGRKEAKKEVKKFDKELKKALHEIRKEENKKIHDLHSHKNKKDLAKQIKDIHKQAKVDSKNAIKEANARIKKKDIDHFVWEALTDHEHGYHLSGLERRNIQSHVPIDRLKHGVVPTKDLEFNAKISDYDTGFLSKDGNSKRVSKKVLTEFTEGIIKGMNVDGAFNHQVEIRNLSGGNQQKFVVGRELFRDHKLLVAGHPTRGLDISAIDHIYTKMRENSAGKATLLYSLEINELMAVCDRIAVMYHGQIIDIVKPSEVTLEEVSRMMIGEGGPKKQASEPTVAEAQKVVKEKTAERELAKKEAAKKKSAPKAEDKKAPVKKAPVKKAAAKKTPTKKGAK